MNHRWLIVAAAQSGTDMTASDRSNAPGETVLTFAPHGIRGLMDPAAAHVVREPPGNGRRSLSSEYGLERQAPWPWARPVQFCEFTGGEGADPADSRISVRSPHWRRIEPSMAATAYLTKPAMAESGGSANPASIYCADLGGAEMGGQLAPDGGWVSGADKTDVARCASSPISRSSTPGDWRTTPWARFAGRIWSRSSAGSRRAQAECSLGNPNAGDTWVFTPVNNAHTR